MEELFVVFSAIGEDAVFHNIVKKVSIVIRSVFASSSGVWIFRVLSLLFVKRFDCCE